MQRKKEEQQRKIKEKLERLGRRREKNKEIKTERKVIEEGGIQNKKQLEEEEKLKLMREQLGIKVDDTGNKSNIVKKKTTRPIQLIIMILKSKREVIIKQNQVEDIESWEQIFEDGEAEQFKQEIDEEKQQIEDQKRQQEQQYYQSFSSTTTKRNFRFIQTCR
ncbi:unnamed protein product [Paramecium octaurelia]|uniref:Uncharacterized protein n=1 Tax=Paramecium octaurelia TaxID=43137 RepID=A0A8S1U4C5_PAROT|nr:unnamed protein product [Paramecium octaurelia]